MRNPSFANDYLPIPEKSFYICNGLGWQFSINAKPFSSMCEYRNVEKNGLGHFSSFMKDGFVGLSLGDVY